MLIRKSNNYIKVTYLECILFQQTSCKRPGLNYIQNMNKIKNQIRVTTTYMGIEILKTFFLLHFNSSNFISHAKQYLKKCNVMCKYITKIRNENRQI